MKIKAIKIVPTEFKNKSRDLRELSVLSSLGCDITVVAKEGKSTENYGYNCVRLTTRPVYRLIHNLNVNRLFAIFTWSHSVRKLHPDIISCHNIESLIIGWLSTLFTRHKAKLVYDSHEFEYARDESRSKWNLLVVKYLERFLIRKSSFSIMVNDSIADEVVKLHHLKYRPVVARNFPYYWRIDESLIKERKEAFVKEYGIDSGGTLVLYQGGLMKRRGIENAIKAITRTDNIYLLIMGDGSSEYVDSLHKLVIDLDLKNRIIFLPAAPYEELWKYTGMADIGLCILENVCKNHYYALPNKFSEYIQSMVPVITNDFPELKRIVDKYHIGRYCDADKVEDLANTIMSVASDKELLQFYKTNLRRAKEELCWEKESKSLTDAYSSLIKEIEGDNHTK